MYTEVGGWEAADDKFWINQALSRALAHEIRLMIVAARRYVKQNPEVFKDLALEPLTRGRQDEINYYNSLGVWHEVFSLLIENKVPECAWWVIRESIINIKDDLIRGTAFMNACIRLSDSLGHRTYRAPWIEQLVVMALDETCFNGDILASDVDLDGVSTVLDEDLSELLKVYRVAKREHTEAILDIYVVDIHIKENLGNYSVVAVKYRLRTDEKWPVTFTLI